MPGGSEGTFFFRRVPLRWEISSLPHLRAHINKALVYIDSAPSANKYVSSA